MDVGAARLPLTPGQHLLDFLESIRPGGTAESFNISFRLAIAGQLDQARLHDAVAQSIERHGALRAGIVRGRGMPEQVISRNAGAAATVRRVRPNQSWDAGHIEQALVSHNNAEFDLASPPLVRTLLLDDGADRRLLQVTVHHSVADAWSLEVLKQDIGRCYRSSARLEPEPAPPSVRYEDLVGQQVAALESPEASLARAFWPGYLHGLDLLRLASDGGPDQPEGGAVTVRAHLELDPAQSALVRAQAAALRATPFMFLAAAYGFVLGHVCGCGEYALPTFTHGRHDTRLQQAIGMLFNPFIIRFRWAPEYSFADLVASFKLDCLHAYRFQWFPLIEVLELCPELAVSMTDPDSRLFPVQMLNVRRAPNLRGLFGPGCVVEDYNIGGTSAGNVLPLDGLLTVRNHEQAMAMTFNAAASLWDQKTALAICSAVAAVCLDSAQDPGIGLRRLGDIVDGQLAIR